MNKRRLGSEQEAVASTYLESRGYSIIERNFNCRIGEIDIVAKDLQYLVFIEVKYRSSIRNGFPEEAITPRKRNTLVQTAKYYMLTHGIQEDTPCRFDVVSILKEHIHLIKNAFDAY